MTFRTTIAWLHLTTVTDIRESLGYLHVYVKPRYIPMERLYARGVK